MTLHYMDGGEPFGTTAVNSGAVCAVLCYELNTGTFLAVRLTGETFWGTAACFDPPPPIPTAARKPKVGEVWMLFGEPVLLVSWDNAAWRIIFPNLVGRAVVSPDNIDRPATPEEAEPFRPLLEGLKASLGEKA
jgi:hypothetical protein